MTELQNRLFAISDSVYADFQAKLTPTIPREQFIGVRLPVLRQFAKDFSKSPECPAFLETLPHEYYDENLLHSVLLCAIKPFETCLAAVERFLPYVNNWAVCDTLSPRIFKKNRTELFPYVQKWIASPTVYTCRFGMDMLMTHYLDEDFRAEYLELPAQVMSDEYYVRMMAAWFYATALAKQWDATISYLEQKRLCDWTHRKTIQKACESFRITDAQKEYLKTLK